MLYRRLSCSLSLASSPSTPARWSGGGFLLLGAAEENVPVTSRRHRARVPSLVSIYRCRLSVLEDLLLHSPIPPAPWGHERNSFIVDKGVPHRITHCVLGPWIIDRREVGHVISRRAYSAEEVACDLLRRSESEFSRTLFSIIEAISSLTSASPRPAMS